MTTRPNVVLIMTDQQRFDSIAALGYSHVDTPNLDRLVREGAAFTRAYVASPSCAPSRASLFTGLYPHTSGVLRNDEKWSHSWVETLADAGYRCTSIGKMHTYPYEASVGFHERHVVENKDRAHPNLPFFLDNWDKALWARGIEKPSRVTYRERDDYRESLGAFEWEPPEDMHADNFVGNLARHWLDAYHGPEGEPFLLQIGFPGPHPPYDPPARVLDAYRDREMPEPAHAAEDLEAQPEAIKALRRQHYDNDHDAIHHLPDPTREQTQRQRRHYYANVTLIDEQVGGIVDALKERGVLDDTVIIFTSDHGDDDPHGQHRLARPDPAAEALVHRDRRGRHLGRREGARAHRNGPVRDLRLAGRHGLALDRNDDYWDAAPDFAQVKYQWRGEGTVRAAMVTSGEADIALGLSADDGAGDLAVSYPNNETIALRFSVRRLRSTTSGSARRSTTRSTRRPSSRRSTLTATRSQPS